MSIDQYFADAGGLNSQDELEVTCGWCGRFDYIYPGTFEGAEEAIENAEPCECGEHRWEVS